MSNVFDVGIIGMGIAGVFCVYKLAKENKNIKIIGFDIGKGPAKRKRQIEGWLGCLTSSDGKIFQSNINKVSNLTGLRKAKAANTYFNNVLKQVDDFKIIKDRAPLVSMDKKLKKLGYDISLNDYIQIYPKEIHKLSKYMSDSIEENTNVTFSFDSEIIRVVKQKNIFVVSTDEQDFYCKELVVAVGR